MTETSAAASPSTARAFLHHAAVVVVAIYAAVALPAEAAAAPVERPVVILDAPVVVEAARPARAVLDVPADAVVSLASVAVTGERTDRFAGVMVVPLDDPNRFSLERIVYPTVGDAGGERHTAASIRVSAEDADRSLLDVVTGADGRHCTEGCRWPAGTYELLVIADGPVTATITPDGTDDGIAATAVSGADLEPLKVFQSVDQPHRVDMQQQPGGFVTGGLGSHDTDAVVFAQARTAVTSAGHAAVDVTYCAESDQVCQDNGISHSVRATAVDFDGRSVTTQRRYVLPAGFHSLLYDYAFTGVVGPSTAEFVLHLLHVYPYEPPQGTG